MSWGCSGVIGWPRAMTEKDFQCQLIALVDMLGGLAYHTYDSRRSAAGFPDLTIVTRDRRVIFSELKVGKRQPTDDQWAWLRALPDHSTYLWRAHTDWDDAARIIQTGHRTGGGMIQDIDGLNVQPLRAIQHERTCVACANAGHILPGTVR